MPLCEGCFTRLQKEANFSFGFEQETCPVCGTAFSEVRKTFFVGCAHCYTALRKELTPVIAQIHGKTEHEGTFPRESAEDLLARRRELVAAREEYLCAGRTEEAEIKERQLGFLELRLGEEGIDV